MKHTSSIIGAAAVIILSVLHVAIAADVLEYEITGDCDSCLLLKDYFKGRAAE